MPNLANARAQRFHAYIERLTTALGHQDRHGPLRAYVTGLCLPGDRKSIEPMAARVDPRHVRARHQSMHHFIANAAWDDAAVLRAARDTLLAALDRHGPLAAWVVDDTGIPKKGRHSVGVARQYCGVLGKQDNCQVAVSVSAAHEQASLPVAYRLYLPREWRVCSRPFVWPNSATTAQPNIAEVIRPSERPISASNAWTTAMNQHVSKGTANTRDPGVI
jgi:SRSO17 transposase